METVLCDCESQLNSRPLTYVSDDPDDLYPLTPDLFLKDIRNSVTVDLDKIRSADKRVLNKRLIYRKRLMSDLRIRFRNEYLSQLHQQFEHKPIRKLCTLELDGESLITNEDEVPDAPGDPERQKVSESNTVTTRAGRQARPPSRYRP
ncbi:hypothetical protein AVEN_208558-1 [Araneus ventricosus]|uniref:Uncharacterized protein n=1 Tax=Araneus ventricosus TaxID=182803 RepID=A0A4Y2U0P8_ARAVE|nr:hypothetical protein AVEN_208558-1 [Araneus ventricosus]